MADKGKAAFIGLGVMGYPMAGHLAANGYGVTVYNRTAAKATAWTEQHGGTAEPTPAAAAAGADSAHLRRQRRRCARGGARR